MSPIVPIVRLRQVMNEPAEEELRQQPRSSRLPFVVIGFALGIVIACVLLISYFRDPIPVLTQPDFVAARTLWKKSRPEHYDLELEITGLRPGKVAVEVRDGEVVRMTRDGKTPSQKRTWEAWTVEGQFETIEREFELAVAPQEQMNLPEGTRVLLHGMFDPQFGYPKRFRRLIMGGQGPEMSWHVTHFSPVNMP